MSQTAQLPAFIEITEGLSNNKRVISLSEVEADPELRRKVIKQKSRDGSTVGLVKHLRDIDSS